MNLCGLVMRDLCEVISYSYLDLFPSILMSYKYILVVQIRMHAAIFSASNKQKILFNVLIKCLDLNKDITMTSNFRQT